jgi:chromosome segregation ATPase
MREKLADCEHRLEVLAGLELEVEAGIEVKNSYNTLQRKHAVLEAVHDKAIAENEELREQLAAALHRAESAENRCAELQEAKARTLAKYTKIRDSNINERLHEATNRLTALSAEHDRVSDLLADARKELTANEEVNSQYVGEYGSVKNMARELEQSKQALAKAKTIQSEGLKKLQELHTRLKTEIDSKNQLQASFQKLNQELLQLKMAKSAAAS